MTSHPPRNPPHGLRRNPAELVTRKAWKAANRPLAMVAWQAGYEGETIISMVPRAAPAAAAVVGIAGAISGIAGQFNGVNLTPSDIRLIEWAIGVGIGTYSFSKYIDVQLEKIKAYIDDPEKRPLYSGSLLRGGEIVTASQAATLGRLIHQIGYGVMGKLGVELEEAETDKIVSYPRTVDQLTEADRRGLIHDYKVLCKLMTLADREGFEKINGIMPLNFGRRFIRPIHTAFAELSAESRHHELCTMYRTAQRQHLPQATAMLDALAAC